MNPQYLEAVESDSTYQIVSTQARNSGAALCRNRRARLDPLMSRVHLGIEASFAIRGSFANGDPTPYSDVDLLLLANDLESAYSRFIAQTLRTTVGISASVQPHQVALARPPQLGALLSLPIVRPLGDRRTFFRIFFSNSLRDLAEIRIGTLVSLWESDSFRNNSLTNPSDPDLWSFKRGIGGTLTCEFCRLMSLWASLRRSRCLASAPLGDIERRYRYLQTLKHQLALRIHSSVELLVRDEIESFAIDPRWPWFFSWKHILDMANETHILMSSLLSLLRTS